MILRQFLHSDPVAASYFVACAGHAAAAIVDPVGDIEPYRALAEKSGTQIRYVVDTHLHADHVSSARELAAATGADYVLFKGAKVAFRSAASATARCSRSATSCSRHCIRRVTRRSTSRLW